MVLGPAWVSNSTAMCSRALHAQYLECGVRNRDDLQQMRRDDRAFSGKTPRF